MEFEFLEAKNLPLLIANYDAVIAERQQPRISPRRAHHVSNQGVAPRHRFGFAGGVCRHSLVTRVQTRVQNMGAQQVFDKLTHPTLANGAPKTVVDLFIQGYGHFFVHGAIQDSHVMRVNGSSGWLNNVAPPAQADPIWP
jgi:hypothetical protein